MDSDGFHGPEVIARLVQEKGGLEEWEGKVLKRLTMRANEMATSKSDHIDFMQR